MDKLELRIIPDNRMIPIAVSAICEYARFYFQSDKDVRNIGLALEEAIANITEHLTGNREYPIVITADAHDGSFELTITDRELPGNLNEVLKDENALGLTVMENLMDDVSIDYLEMGVRRQTLIKKYQTDAMPLSFLDFAEEEIESEGDKHTYVIRPPKKEEMLEIVRMLYDEYGNSYDVEGAYSAENHWNNIQADHAQFLVAVAENGEIAANLTMTRMSYMPGIWDISMAFAKKRYRKGNLLNRLIDTMVSYSENRGDISGLYVEPTVVHPYSQRAFNHYDFMPTGFSLSMMPENIYQPKIASHAGRGSLGICMRIFRDHSKTIYIRPEQKFFVSGIVSSLHIDRIVKTEELPCIHETSQVKVDYIKILETGYVFFDKIGDDFESAFRRTDLDIRKNGGMTNEIFIAADDPGAVFAQNILVKQGYFCVRYMPCPDGYDYIVYAKMYSDPIDYSEISTTSPYTEILEQIRQFDPDQK